MNSNMPHTGANPRSSERRRFFAGNREAFRRQHDYGPWDHRSEYLNLTPILTLFIRLQRFAIGASNGPGHVCEAALRLCRHVRSTEYSYNTRRPTTKATENEFQWSTNERRPIACTTATYSHLKLNVISFNCISLTSSTDCKICIPPCDVLCL